MATDASSNEFNAFCDFLSTLQSSGDCRLTPEQSVEQFRACQEKMIAFQKNNQTAMEQSRQGLSKPLDLESLLSRVEQRIASTPHQE